MKLFILSKVMCVICFALQWGEGEKGESANFKIKCTEPFTQGMTSPLYILTSRIAGFYGRKRWETPHNGPPGILVFFLTNNCELVKNLHDQVSLPGVLVRKFDFRKKNVWETENPGELKSRKLKIRENSKFVMFRLFHPIFVACS